jgi:hypothetical protein
MKSRLLLNIVSALIIVGCEAPLKVITDHDRTVNFYNYSTFAIDSLAEHEQSLSQLNAHRIIEGIKAAMVSKGFEETTSDPDLRVNAVTIMKNRQEVTANTNYYGYGGVYRPYGWGTGSGGAYTTYNVSDYLDGSIIIDIVDARTNKLIWEGAGNKEIDKPSKDLDASIRSAILRIMKDFPPDKRKKK